LFVGAGLTNTIRVTNSGPASASGVFVSYPLANGVLLVYATPSQGSFFGVSNGVVLVNLGGIAAGASASVSIVVAPSLNGTITNIASVSANESDLNPADNTAQTVTVVATPATVRLSGVMTNGNFEISGTGQPGLAYAILISSDFSSWAPIGTNTANAGGTLSLWTSMPSATVCASTAPPVSFPDFHDLCRVRRGLLPFLLSASPARTRRGGRFFYSRRRWNSVTM